MPKNKNIESPQDDCVMWNSNKKTCSGLIKKFYKKAHYAKCPFYKDFETELEQEKYCFDRCQETFTPFYSCLLGEIGNPHEITKEEWLIQHNEMAE